MRQIKASGAEIVPKPLVYRSRDSRPAQEQSERRDKAAALNKFEDDGSFKAKFEGEAEPQPPKRSGNLLKSSQLEDFYSYSLLLDPCMGDTANIKKSWK